MNPSFLARWHTARRCMILPCQQLAHALHRTVALHIVATTRRFRRFDASPFAASAFRNDRTLPTSRALERADLRKKMLMHQMMTRFTSPMKCQRTKPRRTKQAELKKKKKEREKKAKEDSGSIRTHTRIATLPAYEHEPIDVFSFSSENRITARYSWEDQSQHDQSVASTSS